MAPLTPEPPIEAQMPSPAQQSWGALISIVVIVLMVVVGAFYAWGQRVSEEARYQQGLDMTEAGAPQTP